MNILQAELGFPIFVLTLQGNFGALPHTDISNTIKAVASRYLPVCSYYYICSSKYIQNWLYI